MAYLIFHTSPPCIPHRILKAVKKNILIVKSTAKNARIDWEKANLSCMVQCDHSSRPLLKYVCSRLLSAVRNDKIYLARGSANDKAHQVNILFQTDCYLHVYILLLLLGMNYGSLHWFRTLWRRNV